MSCSGYVGSMNHHMSGTIEQLLIQVVFCKKFIPSKSWDSLVARRFE